MQRDPSGDVRERLVVGAIGSWQSSLVNNLLQNDAETLHMRQRSEAGVLYSSGELESYGAGNYFWEPLASDHVPTSWQSASEERMAAGVVVQDDWALVHTCALGVHDVYFRQIGGAVYFANRIEPLLGLLPGPLHVNWEAWASTIVLCSPWGEDTPFAEIKRLGFASGLKYDGELRQVSFDPGFMSALPLSGSSAITPLMMAAVVNEAIPVTRSVDPPPNLTLSGGWDSRLLAPLVIRKSTSGIRSWTTSPDDGYDEDLVIARELAAVLGTEHNEVVPDADSWSQLQVEGYAWFEHQTWLHTWYLPLAAALRRVDGLVVDGVAGGVLLKSAFISEGVLGERPARVRRDEAFLAMSGGRAARQDIFTEEALEWVAVAARRGFDQLTERVEDHPSEFSLYGLLGRTVRGICPSSFNLYGHPARLVAPYLDPRVVQRALEVPEAVKGRRLFNRQVIEVTGGSRVASILSTNDVRTRPTQVPRRQSGAESMKAMSDRIEHDSVVRTLVNDEFAGKLRDRERAVALGQWTGPVQVLQGLSMFAHWRTKYASLLADERPPWA